MTLTKQEVKHKLQSIGYMKEFKVIFTKVNGEQREMVCMMEVPSGPPKNPDLVPVVEVDSGAWKSFRTDSVLYIEEKV